MSTQRQQARLASLLNPAQHLQRDGLHCAVSAASMACLYRSFGGVSYALGCVPILSWLLEFSSTVGAAMWAADMEKSGKIRLL